jgi:uncharacterized protein (DUF433 family)
VVAYRSSGYHLLAIQAAVRKDRVQEFAMAERRRIDWSRCSFVEANPQILGGAPVLRGTRMPVSAIVDNFDYGLSVAEIMEQFDVAKENIEEVLEYAKNHPIADHG